HGGMPHDLFQSVAALERQSRPAGSERGPAPRRHRAAAVRDAQDALGGYIPLAARGGSGVSFSSGDGSSKIESLSSAGSGGNSTFRWGITLAAPCPLREARAG